MGGRTYWCVQGQGLAASSDRSSTPSSPPPLLHGPGCVCGSCAGWTVKCESVKRLCRVRAAVNGERVGTDAYIEMASRADMLSFSPQARTSPRNAIYQYPSRSEALRPHHCNSMLRRVYASEAAEPHGLPTWLPLQQR